MRGLSLKNCVLGFGCALMATMVANNVGEIAAQEFKIETEVYSGDIKTPSAFKTTLFSNGMVYEFLMDGAATPNLIETRIYESRTKTIVLLDPTRQAALELMDLRLLQMVDGQRREIAQDKAAKFLVNEQYDEQSDLSGNWLSLTSPTISFRMQGQRPSETYLPLYNEYLDNFSRIPSSDKRSFPPFPRMRLNESIKKTGWIPSEIQVEMRSNPLPRVKNGFKQTSKHVLIDGLSNQDRERITSAKQQWMQFEKLSLSDYRQLEAVAKATSASKSRR